MIELSDNAKKSFDRYLQQVRAYLRGCKTVDANEIEQNITEHIENEFAAAAEPVSVNDLNIVLEKLGSPKQWIPEEELPWWRKMIFRLRTGPEDWRLAYISFGLLVVGFLILPSSIVLIPASFIVARAALAEAADPNELKSQKWLIYPSLTIVYLFIGCGLFFWPAFLLLECADGMEHPRWIGQEDWENVFPWNANDIDLAYWPIALLFVAAGTALWWFTLGLINKKKPILLQTVFRPFADSIRPRWTDWFLRITLILVIACSIAAVLMIKYRGWYVCLKQIFG